MATAVDDVEDLDSANDVLLLALRTCEEILIRIEEIEKLFDDAPRDS